LIRSVTTRASEVPLHGLYSGLRGKRGGDRGFTLIELLVVVVILGVLIAIAIPLYLNYRKGANDRAAEVDLKNSINVVEQCRAETGIYTNTYGGIYIVTSTNIPNCSISYPAPSAGTSFSFYSLDGTTFIMAATNTNGSGKVYYFNNAVGGQIKAVAGALGAATC